VKLVASHIIIEFVSKNPKWKQHFLSLLMNEATVLIVEIEGIKD